VFFGIVRSILAAFAVGITAVLFQVFDYPTFLGSIYVGLAVFISGFLTGNRSGFGRGLITGFAAALLVLLTGFVLFRLAANSGDSELEQLTYSSFSLSVYLLIGLPVITAVITVILERLGIK
jgi:hypothetical protein